MTPTTRHHAKPKVSFITVVYEAELGLLRLQARSLARFMPEDDVGEVLIVLNDRRPAALAERIMANSADWGPHQSKLRLLDPAEIFEGPACLADLARAGRAKLKQLSRALRRHPATNWARSNGWILQQAMKLAAARKAHGAHLVYLDAKNHFTGAAGSGDFFTPEGVARARFERVQDNYFEWHQSARAFLGLPAISRDQDLPPSITPYSATRSEVLATIDEIRLRSGSVRYFFQPKSPKGTEFTLLAALQMRKQTLAAGLIPFASVFRDASDQDVSDMITKADTGAVRMIGTHSGKLRELTKAQLDPLYRLWEKLGLVANERQAMAIAPPKGIAP